MTCAMCKARGKTWQGSDPTCGFESSEFSTDNWNCATIGAIRSICYEGNELPAGVDYQYCEDQKYATIKVDHIDGLGGALALWLTWYKCRGRTDEMWLLFDGLSPRRPTAEECELIAAAYGEVK
jgi:hypothetical protein